MRYEPDIQKLYDQHLFNRYYAYKNVNLNLSKTYGLKLVFGSLALLLKLALSRFFRPKKLTATSIFIAWSPLHKKRAKDLSENYKLIEYQRLSFSKEQLRHFFPISIKEFLRLLLKIKKSDVAKLENSTLYITDNFQYRILFVAEYLALRGIVFGTKKIFMAGYSDRPGLFIAKLCELNKIELAMLQHGILGKKERWMHLKADHFYYLYPFSKPYVKHQITVTPDTELHYLPKKASSLELKIFTGGKFERNIAYATSPADSEKDVAIIQNLKEGMLQRKYNLLIYPHPLESETTYKHLTEEQSVFISRERHSNINNLISRYSTLGIDYYEQGIVPIFLNYENHHMDFLEEKTFLVFQNPDEFQNWVENLPE